MKTCISILLLIFLSVANTYSQENKDHLLLSLMVAEECNTYANFTENEFDHFIHNNIQITTLESNIININVTFYKINIIEDSIFNFLEKNCREYIIGIMGRPPYKLRLKGFIVNDYFYLYQFLLDEKYTRRDIRDLEVKGIDTDCLQEAFKKRRSHEIIECLEPCGLITIF